MMKYLYGKKVKQTEERVGYITFKNKSSLKKFYALLISKTWKTYYPHEPENMNSYCMIGMYKCEPLLRDNTITVIDLTTI